MSDKQPSNNRKRDRVPPPPPKPGDRRNKSGGGDGPQLPKGRLSGASRTLAFWAIFLLIFIIGYQLLGRQSSRQVELNYTEFETYIDQGTISAITVIANTRVEGKFNSPVTREIGSTVQTYYEFKLFFPSGLIDSEMLTGWGERGIEITFKEGSTPLVTMLIGTLPFLLLIFLWIFMMRQMQGGQRGIFSFGKSRAKLLTGGKVQVTFNDVAGADEAKQELSEIIDFLKEPGKFQKLGGRLPKGVLLLGPPGTGKTLLARAVAGEADVPFYTLSGSDFVEMFVGVGASRVRDLFDQGKNNAPCIIFIDELDAVGRHRGAGLGGGHDEREQTLNQLLVEMDGFESNEGVILISATNRPDVLDPALLRPGRFDRQVVVDLPDVKGREGILLVHTRNVPLAREVDLQILAKTTPGLSGADLANLVNESALLAARFNRDKVTMLDFEEAKDKVMMGAERKSMVISDSEKRQIAYHEAGHALIGKLVPSSDQVHKVTIIPRGQTLGTTHYLPIDERHIHSKDYLVGMIMQLMGGRSAEKLIFDMVTTGGGNDIQRATDIARKMVQEWGMSEELGPIHYGDDQEEIFLGRAIARTVKRSEKTAELIDIEVRKIVESCEEKVDRLLEENEEGLKNLAETLLEYEILSGKEIDVAIQGKPLGRDPGEPEPITTFSENKNGDPEEALDESEPAPDETPENAPDETPENASDETPENAPEGEDTATAAVPEEETPAEKQEEGS